MYSTSNPVTAASFFDRQDEIRKLQTVVEGLRADTPTWLAIIGPRKIGKTSLLLELARRATDSEVVFVVIDCFEELPLLPEIFRRYALRLVDGALGADLGTSLEALASRPAEFRAALQRSSRFDALAPPLRSLILELAESHVDGALVRDLLDLPEQLARSLGIHFLVAWDEFQELATLSSRESSADYLPLMRSRWQRHRRTSYVISGSAPTMLRELVTDERSPFFQHFSMMEVGPFVRDHAVRLLRENAPPDREISEELAGRVFDLIGGHPFYLQLLGDALTRQPMDEEETALKQALQELLFSGTGRLALYFENELRRHAGRSGLLGKTLEVLAAGPARLSDIAKAIHSASGAMARYLERLRDAVVRDPDGRYRLADPVFGLWLAWRQPGGTVVPMSLVGDDAEQAVARHLAAMGFDLIYQSRASRGAFDLLATRGPRQLGVQVKRSALPLRFTAAAWGRMEAEAKRFGWRWVVAAVTPPPDGQVILLDPADARVRKNVTLDAAASIDNLLLWVDRRTTGDSR
jgi:AAA+ ATPase superfamily predicted ATPase